MRVLWWGGLAVPGHVCTSKDQDEIRQESRSPSLLCTCMLLWGCFVATYSDIRKFKSTEVRSHNIYKRRMGCYISITWYPLMLSNFLTKWWMDETHFKDFLHIWSGERSTHLIFDVTFTCEQSNDGWEKSIESHRYTFDRWRWINHTKFK